MSTPKLSLEYFDGPGRAEPVRAALKMANVPFEDVRLKPEAFGAKKAGGEFPLGQVPVLSVDGEKIPQSGAIYRYVARLTGLWPEDPLDSFRADALLETNSELVETIVESLSPLCTPERFKEVRKSATEFHFPRIGAYLDNVAKAQKERHPNSKYIVGDKLSMADIVLHFSFNGWLRTGMLDEIPKDIFEKHTHFIAYLEGIKTDPKIAAYKP